MGRANGRPEESGGENTGPRPENTVDKVLVANRGEIAISISRTLRELGLGAVAVYSEADRAALHVAYADEAYLIGPAPAAESYLKIETLVETALRAGAGAVHPGYGFLAENASFARAVEDAGLVWIGPPPAAIELMGSKTRARQAMQAAGVPIIPGTTDPVGSVDELLALGEEIGYPLLIKAAAGGGGKGMEEVHAPGDAERAFETARRQGPAYCANPTVAGERLSGDTPPVQVQGPWRANETGLCLVREGAGDGSCKERHRCAANSRDHQGQQHRWHRRALGIVHPIAVGNVLITIGRQHRRRQCTLRIMHVCQIFEDRAGLG